MPCWAPALSCRRPRPEETPPAVGRGPSTFKAFGPCPSARTQSWALSLGPLGLGCLVFGRLGSWAFGIWGLGSSGVGRLGDLGLGSWVLGVMRSWASWAS
eukprot:5004659-Pyramimonas_sp.AAC.1